VSCDKQGSSNVDQPSRHKAYTNTGTGILDQREGGSIGAKVTATGME
jgi:hypothetical protein